MNQSSIRNFAIIAHIDHGKSTLADRFLELTGTVKAGQSPSQQLDSHPISRARGITIRLAPVTMHYQLQETSYELNLIDTPGHVDFSYEVERSLAACEGAILLVDATQGVQAQTLSHFYKAQKLGLTIIPAINKIDMPNALVAETEQEIRELTGNKELIVHKISAKTGAGVKELLQAVIERVPAPIGNPDHPTRALVFSSQFDRDRGVIAYIRVVDGNLQSKSRVNFLASKTDATAFEIGHFLPAMTASKTLESGEVGYIITNLKDSLLVKVGDTVTSVNTEPGSIVNALPGYRDPIPMVFVSFFPVDQNDYFLLEDGLEKLKLNDAALSFSPTSSKALGRGYRCGFLGHLHAEVSQERLESDFGLNIIATTPTVEYKTISVLTYEEPWVFATIISPVDYIGPVMSLCQDRRGVLKNMDYHAKNVTLTYELPLSEIITDFFDKLKSSSSGYASIDYELLDYRPFDSVTLEIFINHESIDAFSQIMEKSKAEKYGRFLVERLKDVIPRQQIPIPIQASINGQIIARVDIPAFRKDVTAKLYGGDFTRRLKLLEKQKKGKEKMKQIGKISIPGDTFLKIFQT